MSVEHILRASLTPADTSGGAGVKLHVFVSAGCGAANMSTGIARFAAGAELPWHLHGFSEAITVLEGVACVSIRDRTYQLGTYDCLHIPAGVPHLVKNDAEQGLCVHSAFAAASPSRVLLNQGEPLRFSETDHASGMQEHLVRPTHESIYELAPGAFFSDGFARRFGSQGICGGYGRFLPESSLPCHTHDFDESITIVRGRATCLVQGRRYELSDYDTAFIPRGLPHRFINTSSEEMAMVWVYAGDEPDRVIVDAKLCLES